MAGFQSIERLAREQMRRVLLVRIEYLKNCIVAETEPSALFRLQGKVIEATKIMRDLEDIEPIIDNTIDP